MKVQELINQLRSMPPDADVEVHADEEFQSLTSHVELLGDPAGVQMVALRVEEPPPHIAAILEKQERLADAAADLLASAKRALNVLKSQGESVRPGNVLGALSAAIAKAEGAS